MAAIRPHVKDSSYVNLKMPLGELKDDGTAVYHLCLMQVPVSVYLISGIKLQGIILTMDKESIVLRSGNDQNVMRHAIACISPAIGTFYK